MDTKLLFERERLRQCILTRIARVILDISEGFEQRLPVLCSGKEN